MGDIINFPVERTRPPENKQHKRIKRSQSERTVHTPRRTIIVVEKDND